MKSGNDSQERREHHVGPGAVTIWNITTLVTAAIATVALIILLLLLTGVWDLVLGIIIAVTVLSTAVECAVLNPLRARTLRFQLDDDAFVIRQGAFFQRATVVPRQQILYARIRRGPLLRKFRLATFVIGVLGREFTVPCVGDDIVEILRRDVTSIEGESALLV